jgi:hypothetical protein
MSNWLVVEVSVTIIQYCLLDVNPLAHNPYDCSKVAVGMRHSYQPLAAELFARWMWPPMMTQVFPGMPHPYFSPAVMGWLRSLTLNASRDIMMMIEALEWELQLHSP